MIPGWRKVVLGSALAAALVPAGRAGAANLDISYDISLIGLTIGQATLAGTVDAQRYRIDIQARLTGLASAVGGRGAGSATGTVQGGRPLDSTFAVTTANSSEQRTVRMAIEKRAVSAAEVTPPIEVKTDRVPLTEEHKRGVVDPISALLMPMSANDPRTACDRRIPVFDGAARYDISLSYAGERPVEASGYKGPAVVCAARYTPIAGHRPRRPIKFMAENRDMHVWLAPIAGTNMMIPVKIAVKTMVGMAVVSASRYAVEGR